MIEPIKHRVWITTHERNKKNGENKNHAPGQDVWRHNLLPLHILSPATIYADIDTFFHAIVATIYALDFETSCRRRQNMSLTSK